MIESVCERDLVAQPWIEDADHRALFTMCQALAVAHDEEARVQNTWKKDRTGAAGHWARATKIDVWFDTPARVARLELARLDASPARETFCNALGALSPKLWCTAGLPLDELAAANSCEAVERCANTPSKRAPFDMRAHFKRERIDEAAIQVMRDAACAQVVNKGDALLQELARKLPGGGACKGRRLGLR